jgi:hypothetical protein
MLDWTFELNDAPMSALKLGAFSFPAFSGLAPYVNLRMAACIADYGPIPPGEYYIVDRESGGFLGSFYDLFGQRSDWFALYAIDDKIDDETFCNKVKRGNFRLHPKVGRGISKGCITVNTQKDFDRIRALLKATPTGKIPGTSLSCYGKVTVK